MMDMLIADLTVLTFGSRVAPVLYSMVRLRFALEKSTPYHVTV